MALEGFVDQEGILFGYSVTARRAKDIVNITLRTHPSLRHYGHADSTAAQANLVTVMRHDIETLAGCASTPFEQPDAIRGAFVEISATVAVSYLRALAERFASLPHRDIDSLLAAYPMR